MCDEDSETLFDRNVTKRQWGFATKIHVKLTGHVLAFPLVWRHKRRKVSLMVVKSLITNPQIHTEVQLLLQTSDKF